MSEPGAVERYWFTERGESTPYEEMQAWCRAHDAEDARRLIEHLRLVEQIQDRDAVIAQAREALARGGKERDYGEWHRFTCLDDPCSYVCSDQRAALAAI